MDRDYAAANRDRARRKTKEWAAANPERKRDGDRRYVEANRGRISVQSATYRAENREKILARKAQYVDENKERIREMTRAWRQANKGKVLANVAFRKLKKRNATPPWLTKEHRLQMRRAYEVAEVFTQTLGEPYHVDHVIPISHPLVCGLHVPWNLQVLRGVDNILKGNRFDRDEHIGYSWPEGGLVV